VTEVAQHFMSLAAATGAAVEGQGQQLTQTSRMAGRGEVKPLLKDFQSARRLLVVQRSHEKWSHKRQHVTAGVSGGGHGKEATGAADHPGQGDQMSLLNNRPKCSQTLVL
jgi:hypothetical protein